MTAPILIFGWGNPSRGDDALGPLFIERIESLGLPGVECLTDFQLQVENALDIQGRQCILFVDASFSAAAPFSTSLLAPAHDASFSTHAITPEAVMQVYVDLYGAAPPPCHLLAIRGESFELGAGLSPAAACHLEAALLWTFNWLKEKLSLDQ
ncbi:MAG: hydrogenase maturation protease [Gammaproteobacteria bacterium]|nr:hydrogenase maturation protease [Rhodocyclaceae bacterium]MBU3909727.1 hydrogenase maturation protease [Gammaproteobacteria bacterium]MBU3990557.1 hydrogenase maturation protease [Gammaproteobacteria bacterium]MBU4005260.1 hydrogenase maturation protease [Gammaproteobacteria bacterium]MBU4022438.1 hydrogenase maturation protease [Gammaproteobacteria bacterium]